MHLTIIIPSIRCKELKRFIKRNKKDEDELIVLKTNSTSIEKTLNDSIKNARHDHIVLMNPNDSNLLKDDPLELLRIENSIVLNNLKSNNDVGIKTSIKFDRKKLPKVNKNSKNVVDFIRGVRELINNKLKESTIKVKEENEVKTEEPVKEVIISREEETEHRKEKIKKEKRKKIPDKPRRLSSDKPNILLISDVHGWAWDIKSRYIKKYLEDYYYFNIINTVGKDSTSSIPNRFDLYFTFSYSYVNYIKKFDINKRITGVTAHRRRNLIEKKIKLAHAAHANSVLLYRELEKMHNLCFYVPNGVDEKLFHEKIPVMNNKDKVIFGHVGKKAKLKNQVNILEPAVKKANVKYYPHYNNYLNKIPHNEMVDVHQKYDVYIACSDEDGTPNGMLEAAACGRPIIINSIGNAPEFITNGYNGFIVEKNIDAYVEAMKWFENNPDKVTEMGNNARREIERSWTWELMSKNYKWMFDYILGIKRGMDEYENPAKHHIQS